jgi:hypothetical protein
MDMGKTNGETRTPHMKRQRLRNALNVEKPVLPLMKGRTGLENLKYPNKRTFSLSR